MYVQASDTASGSLLFQAASAFRTCACSGFEWDRSIKLALEQFDTGTTSEYTRPGSTHLLERRLAREGRKRGPGRLLRAQEAALRSNQRAGGNARPDRAAGRRGLGDGGCGDLERPAQHESCWDRAGVPSCLFCMCA